MSEALQTEYSVHPDSDDLARFTRGTLSDADRTKIVEHLAGCVDCSWTAHETEVTLP